MTGKRVLTFIVLMMLIFIAVRFLPGCGEGLEILTKGPGGAATEDWEDWSYRRSVTINNSGTAVTDYQVNVTLDGTFDYGRALPDGSDVRFNYNGTSLSYWIENWDDTGNSSIWVKVPSLPGGNTDTTIYLYYGNADQPAASNFDNTFTKNSGFTGLAAQWHMDEGTGTVISDLSGNSNTGTISGAAWAGTDGGGWYDRSDVSFSSGDSLVFDRSNGDYLEIPDSVSLDVESVTISLWFKVIRVDVTQYFVSKWRSSDDNRSYALYLNGSTPQFDTSFNGATSDTLASSLSVTSGTWYHLAATLGGGEKMLYINGELQDSKPLAGLIFNSSAVLNIGTIYTGLGNCVDGAIDEVSIYNRALSSDEIRALSQRRKYSSDVGLPSLGAEEIVP